MRTQNLNNGPPLEEGLFCNRHDPVPRGTKLLGKYTVERLLGEGGMGLVVAARHDTLGELVAIKFLLPTAMTNHQAVERFLREARASARIKSEHVVAVQDVGALETGEPYMVMEYLEGEDLKSVLRQRGPLPVGEAVDYLVQACKGVSAAHAKNVVHRDLKPANLFLTATADGAPRVKVFDFGIARIVDPNEKDLTNNDIVGSLAYMSPEQLLKSRTADWRTDIWSLGVILCELLTKKRPFDGGRREDLISNILNEDPPPLSTWRTDIPEALDWVLRRCLHKDRTERYQSAHELALATCEAVGMPPPVRPPMGSISIAESYILPDVLVTQEPPALSTPLVPSAEKHEETAKTVADFSVTGQPPGSLRGKRAMLGLAATGALATSAAVVGLVVALQGSDTETGAGANAAVEAGVEAGVEVSASAMPFTSVDEIASSTGNPDAGRFQAEPMTAPVVSIGATIGKNAPVIVTHTTPVEVPNILSSAEPIATTTTSAPNPKPMESQKPPPPQVSATATTTTKKPRKSFY